MSKIILKVKNTDILKEYFQKFSAMGSSLFIIVKKDRFVGHSFSEDRSFIKIATLKFSDVFEEAEIDIANDMYIAMYSKIKRLIMSVSQFSGDYTLILNVKEVTEKPIVNLVKSSGFTKNDKIDVVEFLQFKDSRLNLITKGSKFTVIKDCFDLTSEKIESLFGDSDSESKGEFILEKNDFRQLKTLADAVESKDNDALNFNIDPEKCKIHISSKGSFDFKFPMTECAEEFSIVVARDSLKCFDVENLEVGIKEHTHIGPVIIVNSQESDTMYCCGTYKKTQKEL